MKLNMYVNGEWVDSTNNDLRDFLNPATGEVIGQTVEGTKEDVHQATRAAREAFESGIWSEITHTERANYLSKIAEGIEKNQKELIDAEVLNNGKPIREAESDILESAKCFRYYAGIIRKSIGDVYNVSESMQTMVIREPIGVCGLIVPWNYPLLMSVWKLAPALAAGNTIIIKPSEVTPLTLVKLFEIMDEIGLPKGVVNLVLGDGAVVGNEITVSDEVDMISFTGGTNTGRHIMKAAAETIKKVSLELGGKSPNIFFADTDLELAVDYALYGIFYGTGQVCSAGSRVLVEDKMYDSFVDLFVERAKQIKVGPGDDPNTEIGPLVSQEHMDKVLHYIELGKKEGARLACGGKRLKENDMAKGFFVEPTVFTDVEQHMRIVQEEIFGPVVCIQKFSTEKEAIQLANGTDYGLAGAVFTNDITRALRVIKKVRSGITWINSYHETHYESPWGGYKQSGVGRNLGTYGLDEFMELKQVNINLETSKINWFEE